MKKAYVILFLCLCILVPVCVIWVQHIRQKNLFYEKIQQENQVYLESQHEPSPSKTYGSDIRVLLTDSDDISYEVESVLLSSKEGLVITGAISMEIPGDTVWDALDYLKVGETVSVTSSKAGDAIVVHSLKKGGQVPCYEGTLELTRLETGFRLINQVDLETYLTYVVPSEMPSGYPMEALKVQAVCARTYAVRQMENHALEEYDAHVDDTVNFQVYAHISPQESTNQAVEETRGYIMVYQGEPIEAYFFSTSCGFTSGIEVWNGNREIPYLKAVALSQTPEALSLETSGTFDFETMFEAHIQKMETSDLENQDSWYRWSISFPWEEIQKRVREQFPQVGELQELKVLRRSSGGAMISLEIRGVLEYSVINGEYNVRKFFSPGNHTVILKNGSAAPKQSLLPSAYFVMELEENPKRLTLTGGGYGHGVGMSQNGAKHMAQMGMNWKEIIDKFYQNVTIENWS